MKTAILMAAMLATAIPMFAFPPPGPALPAGKWWDRPEVVQRLGLTSEQRSQIDRVFQNSANDLIDLRGEVEKKSIALRGLLDQAQLNRQAIRDAASRLSDARARLFERELMMFVDMRALLSNEQWNRFRDELSRGPGPDGGGRPGEGPPRQRPLRPRQ